MRTYCFIAVLLWALCASAKVRVVSTIPDLADVAQQIGGDRVETVALLRGTQDPHFADPKPSMMVALNKADLLLSVGLELEQGWLPPLMQGARNNKILPGNAGYLEVSQFVPLLEKRTNVDRSEGDIHKGGNPHFWIDPERMRLIAKGISTALQAIDPDGKAAYETGFKAYDAQLQAKIAEWKAKLSPHQGKKLVEYHRSWIYFLEFSGLVSVGEIEPKPGVEPSPSSVSALLERVRQEQPRLVIQEAYYPQNLSRLFAQKAGAALVILPTMVGAQGTKNYIEVIDSMVNQIIAHLN